MRRITKLFNIDIKSIDEQKRQVTFCFSDDSEDRQGEIVDQSSWDTKNYENNPIILWGHDPSEPENVLGQGVSLDLNNGGKSFITAQFDDAETNPKADLVFRQLVKRTLRCVSAGFISRKEERKAGVPVLMDNELLEVSIVPIPANPRAIALALKDGSISQKDAKWLQTSMKKEIEYIEKQLEQEEEEDNSVSKATETALLTAVEALAKGMDKLNTNIEALNKEKGLVADVAAADHSWEMQDDKWDMFEPVCDLYYALQEAFFFSTTPVDAFSELVKEFASLVASVADGSYEEKSLADSEALGKAFETVKAKDLKELVRKSVAPAEAEEEAEPVVEEPKEEPAEEAEKPADEPAEDEVVEEPAEETDKEAEKDQKPNVAKSTDGGDDEEESDETDEDEEQDETDDSEKLELDGEELDLEGELTPELQAKLDAEMEAALHPTAA